MAPVMSVFDPLTQNSWLQRDELDLVRGQVPILYVEAVPVRVDDHGQVVQVGLLMRMMPDGMYRGAFLVSVSGYSP